MIGLLLKDLLNLKQQVKLFAVLLIIWAAIALVSHNDSYFSGFVMIFSVMIPITSMSYDEKYHWERFALTMPLTRRDIVMAKYLLAFVSGLAGTLVSAALTLANRSPWPETGTSLLAFFGIGMLLTSVVLPFIFWLGVEKGRLIMMAAILIPLLLSALVSQLHIPDMVTPMISKVLLVAVLLIPVLFLLSVSISIQIMKKKDF